MRPMRLTNRILLAGLFLFVMVALWFPMASVRAELQGPQFEKIASLTPGPYWGGSTGLFSITNSYLLTVPPTFITFKAETLPDTPTISFKTVVPKSAGEFVTGLTVTVGTISAAAGTALYRLRHLVGRLGIASRSLSQEVLSIALLCLVSLMAVFLLRTLHLPGDRK